MANYVYDDAAMTAVIDVVNRTSNVFEGAQNAVSTAANTLRTISSAGGDLGADIGGTVLGNINSSLSSATEVLGKMKKVGSIFEQMRKIMNGAASILDTSNGSSILENFANANQDEGLGMIVDVSRLVSDVGEFLPLDPYTGKVVAGMGSAAEAFAGNHYIYDEISDKYIDRWNSGEIGTGEMISGSVGATVTAGVLDFVDTYGKIIGIDIPTSFIDSASYTVGGWLESGYKAVESGVKSLFNWWS